MYNWSASKIRKKYSARTLLSEQIFNLLYVLLEPMQPQNNSMSVHPYKGNSKLAS